MFTLADHSLGHGTLGTVLIVLLVILAVLAIIYFAKRL